MKNKIASAFALGERVTIRSLENTPGRVISVILDNEGLCYKVRYFHNGEMKSVCFYEDELVSMEPCNEPK